MFHVKHSLWRRWCSGRLAVGRAAGCARGRRPAREPSVPRASLGASSRSPARPRRRPRAPQPGPPDPPAPSTPAASDVLARPGPATAHGHRSQALTPPTAPPPVISNVQPASESPVIRKYIERYTFSTDLSRHFPPISLSRPLTLQPGLAALAGLVVSGALIQLRGVVLVERDVGEWCLVPVRVCKKSAAPAGLRTCVELRRGRNSLSGGRPSPGAWRRRAR